MWVARCHGRPAPHRDHRRSARHHRRVHAPPTADRRRDCGTFSSNERPDPPVTMYLRTSEVIGLPVVTIDGGEDVAEVRDVVYSSETGTLLGFTLNKRGFLRGRMRSVLPAASIAAIGQHAVMVDDDDDALTDKSDAPDAMASPATDRNVLKNVVMTEGGTRLGTVTDLVLAVGGRGEIVGYELRRDDTKEPWFIPRPTQVAVSGDTLLVPDTLEQYVSHDLSGFALTVDRYRTEVA